MFLYVLVGILVEIRKFFFDRRGYLGYLHKEYFQRDKVWWEHFIISQLWNRNEGPVPKRIFDYVTYNEFIKYGRGVEDITTNFANYVYSIFGN